MNEPVRLCRDCRHCRPSLGWNDSVKTLEYAKCTASALSSISLVTGEPDHLYCGTMRDGLGCTPSAKLFEPKP